MRRALLAAALLLGAASPADYAWQPHPGAAVPLDAPLLDEAGHSATLRTALRPGRPVVLDLGYFSCTTLCGTARADMAAALRESGLPPASYDVATLSIDPRERPADAAAARAEVLAALPGADPAGWHVLTGQGAAAVARAVGFPYRYDDALQEYLHPTGLVLLTSDGTVSGYLQGVGYAGGELRAAVLRAGSGGIAQAALPVLLLCFHFDQATGRYTLAVEKLLRLMAALTVLTLGGTLLLLHRRRPAA